MSEGNQTSNEGNQTSNEGNQTSNEGNQTSNEGNQTGKLQKHYMYRKYYIKKYNILTIWDIVKSYPQMPWDTFYLSLNPDTTLEVILSNPYIPYVKFHDYDRNSWEIIPHKKENLMIEGLSENPNITPKIIYANLDKKWWWRKLSFNTNLTLSFIRANRNRLDWELLSANPIITLNIVNNNPDLDWNYKGLSRNPNITWDIVLKNPEKNWNYRELLINPNITPDIVEKNPDKFNVDDKYYWLSRNTNVTIEYIKKYSDDCDMSSISRLNSNITLDIVKSNSDINYWGLDEFSLYNTNIDLSDWLLNKSFNWDIKNLSMNSSIFWQIMNLNREKLKKIHDFDWYFSIFDIKEIDKKLLYDFFSYISHTSQDINKIVKYHKYREKINRMLKRNNKYYFDNIYSVTKFL
jgi:hypothetical protein